MIPSYPRKTPFPIITNNPAPEVLVKTCTELLEEFGELIDSCHPDVRKHLTGGTVHARRWAIRAAQDQHRRAYDEMLVNYYEQLEAQRQQVLTTEIYEIVQWMPASILEPIQMIKAEPGMGQDKRKQLLEALWAVKNLLKEVAKAEATPKPAPKPSTSKKAAAHRSARAKRRTTGAIGRETKSKQARQKSKKGRAAKV